MPANPLVRGPILPLFLEGVIRDCAEMERKLIGRQMAEAFKKGEFSLGRGAQEGETSIGEEVK